MLRIHDVAIAPVACRTDHLHYRIALGSAREVRAAEAAGYIGRCGPDLQNKMNQVIGPLRRCVYKP